MKNFVLAGLSAIAAWTFVPATASSASPAFTWTGCYIGAHAGYGFGHTDMNSSNVYGNGFEVANLHIDGFQGGGQAGCNYQFPSSWVVGIDVSYSGGRIKGTGLDGYVPFGPHYDTDTLNNLGAATGRVGWTGFNPQLLLYAKGGAAWADLEYVNSYPLAGPPYSGKHGRSGWTVGAGGEWGFAERWSLFLEYNHYDFGTKKMQDYFGDTPFPIKLTVDTVKAGINFRFFPQP